MTVPGFEKLWMSVRNSLWARPLMLIIAGIALGLLLPAVDQTAHFATRLQQRPWIQLYLGGSPDGTREVITTSVSALATILAVGFSMMMLTVQLAASQYTSRLLRTFMADGVTQWVLGIFIATIVFLLLVARTVTAPVDDHPGFVPLLSFLVGMVLTVTCLALLAFFLHHTTRSVDASNIIARVGKQTLRLLREMPYQTAPTVGDLELEPQVPPAQVRSEMTGYVQLLHEQQIARALPKGTKVARLDVRTGDFIVPGVPLVSYWPDVPLPERARRRVLRAVVVGSERTLEQDVLYGVRKLVDMALKALSPAVNDVTTALMVVNELGAILCAVAQRKRAGTGWRVREFDGVPVLADAFGLQPLLDEAYGEMTRAAREHPRVLARMLETLAQAARQVRDPEMLRLLRDRGARIVETVEGTAILSSERQVLVERLEQLRGALHHAPEEAHRPEPVH